MEGDWKQTTIEEFCPFTYGKGLPERARKAGSIKVFGSNGVVGFHNQPLVNGPGIIIGRKGTVGAIHYSKEPFWPIDTSFYIANTTEYDLRFTYYLLQSLGLNRMNADSAVPGLNREAAHSKKVMVPSLIEQQRIAHILGTLDDKIELNRQTNETLEAMAQALFKSWFVDFDPVIDKALAAGKEIPEPLQERATRRQTLGEQRKPLPSEINSLFPDEFVESELGWIPNGWKNGTLTDLATTNPSEKIPKGTQAPFVDMKAVPQTGSCISNITKKPFSSGSKFRNGDVLLARITPCLENGKTALVQCLHPDEIGHGSTEFITLRPLHQKSSGLVYLIARDEVFREYCINNMTGSSGRQRVAAPQVAAYPMPIPPIALTNHFTDMTDHLFVKTGRLDKENQTLASLRDTLLPKLISGEIRVPEAKDILAEAVHE